MYSTVASIGQVKTRFFFQKKDDFFYKTGLVFIKLDAFLYNWTRFYKTGRVFINLASFL